MSFVSCKEEVKEQGDRGYHVKVGDKVENISFRLIDRDEFDMMKNKISELLLYN